MAFAEGVAFGFLVGLLVGGALIAMLYQKKAAHDKAIKDKEKATSPSSASTPTTPTPTPLFSDPRPGTPPAAVPPGAHVGGQGHGDSNYRGGTMCWCGEDHGPHNYLGGTVCWCGTFNDHIGQPR